MQPLTDTLEHTFTMPRETGLLRRGDRYYVNIKVPQDLVASFGKPIIRKALKTSDYREACRKVLMQRAHWASVFETERAKLARLNPAPREEKRLLTAAPRNELFDLARLFLILQEGKFAEWMAGEGRFLPEIEKRNLTSTVDYDAAYYEDGDGDRMPPDGSDELNRFLSSQGIECPATSPAFQSLRSLFYHANLEYLQRATDIARERTVRHRNPTFRGIHPHSKAPEPSKRYTVEDLLKARAKSLADGSIKTLVATRPAERLMREVLGKGTPLSSITREDMERLFEVMENIPLNSVQRYPGKTYMQAIKEAKRKGDNRKPHQNTNWGTYTQILAIFNYGIDAEMMEKNPAKGKIYRKRFKKERSTPRRQFTVEELNRLFRAPLFTGCVDDEYSYMTAGSNHPRRGRFWVPLLCLFHGMRNNEACQFYTEDLKEEAGVHYLAIREELDQGTKSEKKLKTAQSARNVPIHPELIRIGFLEFVQERRKDRKSPRLFPELKGGHNGYFSDAFSKWFSRFVKITIPGCEATLHSFRHQFRDATRAARLTNEVVGKLAGWEHGQKESGLQMHQYGGGPQVLKLLAEDIAKIEYPGLDLSHLYPSEDLPSSPLVNLRE